MISAHLTGGLGNQLFQIATGVALARDNNDTFGIDYDQPFSAMTGKPPIHYRKTMYKKIPLTGWPRSCFNITEQQEAKYHLLNYKFCNPMPDMPFIILRGYFQSSKYFNHHRGFLRELFYFPRHIQNKVDPVLNAMTETSKMVRYRTKHTVGIHIRRGDYLTIPKILPPCTLEYYRKSVNLMDNTWKNYRKQYIVCTDSPDMVIKEFAEEFNSGKFILSNAKDELEDLYILSRCQSIIMSNSSFSWWGAYLGRTKAHTIAPLKWFGPEGPKEWHDIYPPHCWTQ